MNRKSFATGLTTYTRIVHNELDLMVVDKNLVFMPTSLNQAFVFAKLCNKHIKIGVKTQNLVFCQELNVNKALFEMTLKRLLTFKRQKSDNSICAFCKIGYSKKTLFSCMTFEKILQVMQDVEDAMQDVLDVHYVI